MDMPYVSCRISPSISHDVSPVIRNRAIIQKVKVEDLDPIIELSSESEGEPPHWRLQKQPCAIPSGLQDVDMQNLILDAPCNSPALSSHSRPLVHPILVERVNIMDCLFCLV